MPGKRVVLMAISLLLCAVFLLCACNTSSDSDSLGAPLMDEINNDTAVSGSAPVTPLALVTTLERMDSAFGQSVWQAVSRFAGEQGLSSAVYRAENDDENAARSTLELAMAGGAQVVVAMGDSVCAASAAEAARQKNIDFVLLDLPLGSENPHTVAVYQDALSVGWMAGYAAVSAGLSDVVCLWEENDVSKDYAFGFLQGCNAAAADGKSEKPVTVRMFYWQEAADTTVLAGLLAQRPQLVMSTLAAWWPVGELTDARQGLKVIAPLCQEDVPAGRLWALVEADPTAAVTEALNRLHKNNAAPGEKLFIFAGEDGVRMATGLGNSHQDTLDAATRFASGSTHRRPLLRAAETLREGFPAVENGQKSAYPQLTVQLLPGEEPLVWASVAEASSGATDLPPENADIPAPDPPAAAPPAADPPMAEGATSAPDETQGALGEG